MWNHMQIMVIFVPEGPVLIITADVTTYILTYLISITIMTDTAINPTYFCIRVSTRVRLISPWFYKENNKLRD
jgi:hypothetical protein